MKRFGLTFGMLLALPFAAAGQDTGRPASVVVEPAELTLQVDGTARLSARALDDAGQGLENAPLRWLAVTPDVVSVSEEGVVTALRPGEGQVAALSGGVLGFAAVRVAQLPPDRISLDAPALTVAAGRGLPLTVSATTRLGDPVAVAGVRYRSSEPAVAGVDATGHVWGRSPGTARVSAELPSGPSATLDVRVTPARGGAPSLAPMTAEARTGDVVRFSAGAGVFPAWTVSGPGAGVRAEGDEGVFVAEEPGTYRVSAQVGEGLVRTAVVTVTPRESAARLEQLGRGPAADHHSGDMWVFEGLDGRDYVYIGTYLHDWMKVWDVTDPSNPVLTDSLQVDARRINDVKVHADREVAIITREGASDRRNGMVLLDIRTPAHPTILSQYVETVTGGVHNVWIEGDLVYAAHNGTSDIHIIDISEPERPVEVGRWGLDKEDKTLHDVIVQDGYAYLSYWDDGVVILDVGASTHGGTPTEPAFVSRYAYPQGNTHVAWRHGDYLFVGDEIFPDDWDADRPIEARGYIHVLDVTDIDHPREVATYEVPEAGAHNVWVEEDRLYVGYYQAGLRVVDISGELRGDLYRQGRELASLKTTDAASTVPNWPMTWGAQIFKGRIYSSDLNSGLWISRLIEGPRVVF
ncbi:MAG: hypothetical protein KY453_06340 [Gemmatimonadetes bacterium]|nr:hypothetical protein [Gemmatimonadota bacterium]